MQNLLNITLVQAHLHWENPVANRKHFETLIEAETKDTHLIILPEMFTTGFSMNASQLAETMQGDTVSWMKGLAKAKNAAICGSVIITENNDFYNRFLFVKPSGEIDYYDKRHTFNMAGEGEIFECGTKQVVIDYLGWKLCLQVCYDLRFPVFARNTQGYDALIYVANWPKPRVAAWDALLKARAIENMSYCIGVNRVGLDGNGLEYVGHSGVYDVLGEEVALAKAEEKTSTVSLSKKHVEATRAQLPFLEDKDNFTLH